VGASPAAAEENRLTATLAPAPPQGTLLPSDRDVLARYWHPVAFSKDVAPGPFAARLLDVDLVVYRTADAVVVARDLCIHRGTPLTLGHVDGDELVCRYHGWRYAADGRCTLIPSRGPGSVPARARLLVVPSLERYGLVWACLDPAGQSTLPDWPEAEATEFRVVYPELQEWATSAGRQIENFLDVSHFSFVHRGTFGNPDRPLVPDIQIEPTAHGLRFEYEYDAGNPDSSPLDGAPVVRRRMHYDLCLPFAARLVIAYDDGRRDVVCVATAPAEAARARIFFFVARNYDLEQPEERFLAWDMAILEEDRQIVECQRPEQLPLDLRDELHVRADVMAVAYRRALTELGLGIRFTS